MPMCHPLPPSGDRGLRSSGQYEELDERERRSSVVGGELIGKASANRRRIIPQYTYSTEKNKIATL